MEDYWLRVSDIRILQLSANRSDYNSYYSFESTFSMNEEYLYIWHKANKWDHYLQITLPNQQIQQIQSGLKHFVIRTTNAVYGYGCNAHGQLGFDNHDDEIKQIVQISTPYLQTKIINISCGWNHTLLLDQVGNIFSAGEGKNGALGHGRQADSCTFKPIEGLRNVKYISAGKDHSLALSNIKVYGWGNSMEGQLGIPKEKVCYMPQQLYIYPSRICYAGSKYSIFVTEKGIYATGLNDSGQLGFGNKLKIKLPKKVNNIDEEIIAISGSSNYSILQTASRQFYIAGAGCLGHYLYHTKIKHFRSCQELLISEQFGVAKLGPNCYMSWDATQQCAPQQNQLLSRLNIQRIIAGPKSFACTLAVDSVRAFSQYQSRQNFRNKGIRNDLMARSSIDYAQGHQNCTADNKQKKPRKQSEAIQSRNLQLEDAWKQAALKQNPHQIPKHGLCTQLEWLGRQDCSADGSVEIVDSRRIKRQQITSPYFRKELNNSRELKMSSHQVVMTNRMEEFGKNQTQRNQYSLRNHQLQFAIEKQFRHELDSNIAPRQSDQIYDHNSQSQLSNSLEAQQAQHSNDSQIRSVIQNREMANRLQQLEAQNKRKDQQIRKIRKQMLDLLDLVESNAAFAKIGQERHRALLQYGQNKEEQETDLFGANAQQLRNIISKAVDFLNDKKLAA